VLPETSFLSVRPAHGSRQLQCLRSQFGTQLPSATLVMVAALAPALGKPSRKGHVHQTPLSAVCAMVIQEKNRSTSIQILWSPISNGDAVCAWFPKESPSLAVRTAIAIRSAYLCDAQKDLRPLLLAVGSDEGKACRLLYLAGDNQGIVEPSIWKHLEVSEQRFADDAGVHLPQTEEIGRLIGELAIELTRVVRRPRVTAEEKAVSSAR
jgi:hypothetical protein